MISPKEFYETLARSGVTFFAGVPDSLLKEFCTYVDAVLPPARHVITVNEGTAISLAAGVHLATGVLPLVYLQNSGIGNAVNPLLSLADPEVYGIPMIILVGWRGEPGVKDEPQHIKQGRVTTAMLRAMELPYRVLNGNSEGASESAAWAVKTARKINGPVALLVTKGAFDKAEMGCPDKHFPGTMLTREAAISLVTGAIRPDSTVVATTGMISRELYEQREILRQDRSRDFLTVGSMGHASQIALGIAKALPEADVTCLDGDGAALMHLGGMATIGASGTGNLLHILLNNGVHDSVGGQPTTALCVSMSDIARACGYSAVIGPLVETDEVRAAVKELSNMSGRRFLEIRVRPGYRADLGRPKESPAQNKTLFIGRLRS